MLMSIEYYINYKINDTQLLFLTIVIFETGNMYCPKIFLCYQNIYIQWAQRFVNCYWHNIFGPK